MQPYEYQTACLNILSHVHASGKNRALVVMATGLGKTAVAAFDVLDYIRKNPNARVLYLSHQADILRQAKVTFENVLSDINPRFGYFIDQTRTTRPKTVLFASLQLMVGHKELFDPSTFDYIIVDESHHGAADTYFQVIRYFKPKFLLGITATPERMDQKSITAIFGMPVFDMPLEQALVRGYLSRIDYHLVTDEITNLKSLDTPIGKQSIRKLNRTIFLKKRDDEIASIIRNKSLAIANPKTIIFCNSIAHCNQMAAVMPGALPLHSRLSRETRDVRLKEFREGTIGTLLVRDILNEGIDIPDANLIVFLRSTQSRTVWLQQLGRGLRIIAGKSHVTILDFVANCERILLIKDLHDRLNEDVGKLQSDFLTPTYLYSGGNFDFDDISLRILDVIREVRLGYTHDNLLKMLISLAAQLGRTPMAADIDRSASTASVTTYISYFGTLQSALVRAGLSIKSRENLISHLTRLAGELGRTPRSVDVEADERSPSLYLFSSVFGSYNNALAAANLSVNMNRGVSDDDHLKMLRDLAEKLGKTPVQNDILMDPDTPSIAAYRRRFGSIANALILAGFEDRYKGETRKKQLISELRDYAVKLGRTPTSQEMINGVEISSYYVYMSVFGSWAEALKLAGLERNTRAVYGESTEKKKARLLEDLKRYASRLGRTPTTREMDTEPSVLNHSTYQVVFGTWQEALRAAELTPNKTGINIKR